MISFLKPYTEAVTEGNNKEIILLGDFNIDLIKSNSNAKMSEFLASISKCFCFDVQCILLRKIKILLSQRCLCFINFKIFFLFQPLHEDVMSGKSCTFWLVCQGGKISIFSTDPGKILSILRFV